MFDQFISHLMSKLTSRNDTDTLIYVIQNGSRSNQPARSTQPGHPSLGKHRCVPADRGWSFGHHQGRNVEFCVTIGPVTRTAHKLAWLVKGAEPAVQSMWVVCCLIGFNPHRLKPLKKWMSFHAVGVRLCKIFFFFFTIVLTAKWQTDWVDSYQKETGNRRNCS